MFHFSVDATINAIRQKLWIPCIRQQVKSVYLRCTKCRRESGFPYRSPNPAPLPPCRVTESYPFAMMGIDYTGAITIKGKSKGEQSSAYIILMTCGITRAVHLEVVEDMTTNELIEALRRFAGHHPWPAAIYSDNAATFQSAANELNRILNDPLLLTYLSDRQTGWKFITKRAPWHGGFWERLIGLTKTALRKMAGRTKLSINELRTIVTEIEAVLNDRPLTHVTTECSGVEALTPSHLLYGRRLTLLPYNLATEEEIEDPNFGKNPSEITKQFARRQNIQRAFWRLWRSQYLPALRQQHQSFTGTQQQLIKVGDVVLIHDDCKRIEWKLAVVEKLLPGEDGAIRSAEIRTANGKTNRPINKLYPLEVNEFADASTADDIETNAAHNDAVDDTASTGEAHDNSPQPRHQRKAAVAANHRIRELLDNEEE